MLSKDVIKKTSFFAEKIGKILRSDEYSYMLENNNHLTLVVYHNTEKYLVSITKQKSEWAISNFKLLDNLKYKTLITKPTSVSGGTLFPTTLSQSIAENLIDIIKNRVYKDQWYPSFREIFQNSLGARDLTDPKIENGATVIQFLLGEDDSNNVDSCLLIDNGVGMDLKVCYDESVETNPYYFGGDMGIFLWSPTISKKRKGLSYTVNLEEQRIDPDIPGYFGIGFLSFASVWKQVIVLSKMKNDTFGITFNTNTNLLSFTEEEEKGAFYGYTFPKDVFTIEDLEQSESKIYKMDVINLHLQQFKYSEIKDKVLKFIDLPIHVQKNIKKLFGLFINKFNINSKVKATKSHGTIIYGFDPLPDESGKMPHILEDPETLIEKIAFYTGFEQITGIKRDITLVFRDKTYDITTNAENDIFLEKGYKDVFTKKFTLEAKLRNPEISPEKYEELEFRGKLIKGKHYRIIEEKRKLSITTHIVPYELLPDLVIYNRHDSHVGSIILLQNGIPVTPLELTVYTIDGKVDDTFDQLSKGEVDQGLFFSNIVHLSWLYQHTNVKILVNVNWISVNMGRDGILTDIRYKYLEKLISLSIKSTIKKFMSKYYTTERVFALYNNDDFDNAIFFNMFYCRLRLCRYASENSRTDAEFQKILGVFSQVQFFEYIDSEIFSVSKMLGLGKNEVGLKNGTIIYCRILTTDRQDVVNLEILDQEYRKEYSSLKDKIRVPEMTINDDQFFLFGFLLLYFKDRIRKKDLKIFVVDSNCGDSEKSIMRYIFEYPIQCIKHLPGDHIPPPKHEEVKKQDLEAIFKKRVEYIEKITRNIVKFLILDFISNFMIGGNITFSDSNDKLYFNKGTVNEIEQSLPTYVYQVEVEIERITKVLETDFSKSNHLFMVKTVSGEYKELARYNTKDFTIGLNLNSVLYKKLIKLAAEKNKTMLIILLHDIIIHEIAHEPVIGLLINLAYGEITTLAHKFPQFADSITWMEIRLKDFFITHIDKIPSLNPRQTQKGLESFFETKEKIVKIRRLLNTVQESQELYRCGKCKYRLFKISDTEYICIHCNRIIEM
jgi:hypothetical protein